MKTRLLVPRNMVREIPDNADAMRLLASGSWVEVSTTKPLGKIAVIQRNLRRRYREAGKKRLTAYVSSAVFDQWQVAKRPDESNAELISRLLRIAKLIG